MTKTELKKASMGYLKSANTCRNCVHRVSIFATWKGEKKVICASDDKYAFTDHYRCWIGDFRVCQMAVCDKWEPKE